MPGGQCKQLIAPVPSANCPAAHGLQNSPVASWYLPTAQPEQAVAGAAAKLPSGQVLHDGALNDVLILPWGHAAHQSPPAHPPRTYAPGRHASVGATVGVLVGVLVGLLVGVAVVGAAVGDLVGALLGLAVGLSVGALLGDLVGAPVGDAVGALVGLSVGVAVVGGSVGAGVGIATHSVAPVTASAVQAPVGRSRHRSYAPAPWYLPDGQWAQETALGPSANMPAAQSLHDWPADAW